MRNIILIKFLAVIGIFIASYQSQALDVNVEVDINTTTGYRNCEKYAEAIVELVKLFVLSEKDDDKTCVYGQINFLKENLKNCERKNGKKSPQVKLKFGHTF